MEQDIPICQQYLLTVQDGAKYFRIGENKLRQIINNNPTADFLLRVGNRTLIKRKKFEELLDRVDCI